MKSLKQIGHIIIVSCLILVMYGWNSSVLAQQQIEKKEVPARVINAIEKDYTSCKENISWFVSESDISPTEYVVSAKGEGITCESHYDENGRLLWAKTVLIDTKIPAPILKAIVADYPDWKITGDRAVIHDFNENTKKFEVAITKAEETKYLYYSADGKKLKRVSSEDFPRKRTDRDQVPESIVSAIEADYMSCREDATWYVDKDYSADRAEVYVAKATGRNMSCEATYDKDGNLIESKTIMTNVKLPEGILKAINEEFPGWKITEDQEIIRNFDNSQKYYKVTISSNGETKVLHYDAAGKKVEPIM